VVWRSGPFEFRTCPVLELDPVADYYCDWLLATHHLTDAGWVLDQLPGPGGVGDQDARLMQGIYLARDEADAIFREQQAAARRDQVFADHFEEVEQEARR
jgi:hypothetical protein